MRECKREIPPDRQLRTLRNVDPNGRINIGRKFAFRSFSLYQVPDGRIVLSPIDFVETHAIEAWRVAAQNTEAPEPPEPLHHIPNEMSARRRGRY